jgi:hypothetical protein
MPKKSQLVGYCSAAASFAMLAYLLHRAGIFPVIQSVRLLGRGFLVLLLLAGIRQALRSIAWQQCVDPRASRQRFGDLFALRLLGESASDLSPAGPLVGETVKVWAVSKKIPAAFAVTSVVTENVIYCIGTALFVFVGFLAVLASAGHSDHLIRLSEAAVLSSMVAAILGTIVWRNGLPEKALRHIRKAHGVEALYSKYGRDISDWEAGITQFFQARRPLIMVLVAIEILANLTSFAETYLILKGVTAHASFFSAFVVEAANRGVLLVSSFIPVGFGVDEGATTATLHLLGRTLGEGVSVAAIRKIRSVMWDLLGLALTAHLIFARRARRGNSVFEPRRVEEPVEMATAEKAA